MEADPEQAHRLLESVPVSYVIVDELPHRDFVRRYALPAVESHPASWHLVHAIDSTRIFAHAVAAGTVTLNATHIEEDSLNIARIIFGAATYARTRSRRSRFASCNACQSASASVTITGDIVIQSSMTGCCGGRRRFVILFIFCQARRFSSSAVESFGSRALFCGFRGGKTPSLP